MFLIENAATVEDEDESGYQSPVDILFQGLEDEKPEHIAVRQYKIFKQASGVVCYKRLIYRYRNTVCLYYKMLTFFCKL